MKQPKSQHKILPLRKAAALILLYPPPEPNHSPYKTILLKRKSTMSFSNTYVFPGGACDKEDKLLACSQQFVQYGRITAIREFLEETGILVYPRANRERILCDQGVLKGDIKLISQNLKEIWGDGLGLIEPVLRLMTPQGQKGKRFDTIFYVCRIGQEISLLNTYSLTQSLDKSVPILKKLNFHQTLTHQSLAYNKSQSDDLIFDSLTSILNKFKQGKIMLIPPQIILFTGLIKMQSLGHLGRMCKGMSRKDGECKERQEQGQWQGFVIEPVMFHFNFGNRRLVVFGDGKYDHKKILQQQPESQSKKQYQSHIASKLTRQPLNSKVYRYIQFRQDACYISNHEQTLQKDKHKDKIGYKMFFQYLPHAQVETMGQINTKSKL